MYYFTYLLLLVTYLLLHYTPHNHTFALLSNMPWDDDFSQLTVNINYVPTHWYKSLLLLFVQQTCYDV